MSTATSPSKCVDFSRLIGLYYTATTDRTDADRESTAFRKQIAEESNYWQRVYMIRDHVVRHVDSLHLAEMEERLAALNNTVNVFEQEIKNAIEAQAIAVTPKAREEWRRFTHRLGKMADRIKDLCKDVGIEVHYLQVGIRFLKKEREEERRLRILMMPRRG